MRLSDLLNQVQIKADDLGSDPEIVGFGTLDEATSEQLSFLGNAKYRHLIQQTKAAAILVREAQDDAPCPQIVVSDPYIAMAHILDTLFPEPKHQPGIHPSAAIEDGVEIDKSAWIGPFCHIGAGSKIGPNCQIKGHVSIGQKVSIGENTTIFPQATIYAGCHIGKHVRIHANAAIGSDGYGYVIDQGKHRKIPQIGHVILGDFVEIGAGTTIDRGALKPTIIGEGCKIDNLVQIAHGVQMGKHCLIVSQAGIAGSASLGDYVVLAGQVGVVGHVHIADQITVLGKSVVTKALNKPGSYAGNPAIPVFQYQRQLASLRAADKIRGRLSKLEKLFEQKGKEHA